MFRKFIITVICCLSIFALSAVPSFAATMSDKEMAIEQISLCWQTSTNKKNVISFDSLTSLCADLNRNGYPCEIRFVSALNGYAILGTGYVHNTFESARVYSLSGKYYSNVEGSIFYSPYQSDSLLSSISTFLSAVSSTVSTISDTLSKWPSTLSTVSTISTNLYNFQTNVQKSLSDLYSAATGYFDSQVYSDLPTMFSRMAHDYYYGSADERTAISAAFDRYWLTSMSSGKSYVSSEVLNDICADLNKANIRCSVYYDSDLGLSYIKGLGGPYIVDPSDWNPSGAAYEALSTSNRIFAVRELAVVSSNRNLSYYAAQASGRLLKTVDNVQYTVADLQYNTWQQTKSAVTKLGSMDG